MMRAEELRDWFGNVRLTTTHHVTRGLIIDLIHAGGTEVFKQVAFGMGRRFNVEPNEVDFRPGGWGPIYSDESTYLVRQTAVVFFDIKPGSCPNPINPRSKGVLRVAPLGTADFDVHDIDVSSLLLEEAPDGCDDLTLEFRTQDIVAAIWPAVAGDEMVMTISGSLRDGTPFASSDGVVVVGSPKNSSPAGRSN